MSRMARAVSLGGRLGWAGLIAILLLASAACAPRSGPLGSVRVAPGEAIQIRAVNVLTGLAGVGLSGAANQRGVEIALSDYGDIKGHPVTMGAGLDSRCTADGGADAARVVIGDPRVVGVIGTYCSFAAAAAAPIISEAGLVMISPSNTSPSLTSDLLGNVGSNHREGYYRTSNNDLYQGRVVAKFAYQELRVRRVSAIHDGDPYTMGLASAFAASFEDFGGSVSIFSVNKGSIDMVPTLTRAAAGGPDALFLPLFPDEGGHIVEQLDQVAGLEEVTLIGGAALLNTQFLQVPESEGLYLAGPQSDFGSNTNEATNRSWAALVEEYRQAYHDEPSTVYLPHAYDAATILLSAIEEVAVEAGGALYIDRAKLREALMDIEGFRGIIGTISCDDFGDCGTGVVQIVHHTDSSVNDPAKLPIVYRANP